MTKEKVFDGDEGTFFDAPTGNGQWAGLDLGIQRAITCIKYRPRSGYESRMRGGQFQISNTADFSNPITIYSIPIDATLSFQDYYITSNDVGGLNARYIRYLSPDGGWGNIAEINLFSRGESRESNSSSVYAKKEKRILKNLNVYPNESDGNFKISFDLTEDAEVNYRIFSLSGHTFRSDSRIYNKGNIVWEITAKVLSSNVYILEVATATEKEIRRIVIAK